ncbi:serine/threonine-protein phosphatase 6 regulatory ankyrin repeat subunit B-like [Haliotis cracherodii]|uniref:serine/threonine-protein phosphatase 6 regulatory ankyrin repeat subunit B-like n=1 Tax=Haliotis cracherodii TaxID=6455 RepID=UPI0039EB3BA3
MADSDSSVSSSYSSDGPYLMSYGKTYDSDEPDGNAVISVHAFPSSVLSQSEQHDMLRTLHEESDKPSLWIFPQNARKHLSDKFPLIKRRLEELLQQDCAIIIAGHSLLNLTEASWQGEVPMSVICDVCVFSPAHPLMILTFTTNRPETAVRHNSYLARSIIRAIVGETQLNFNVFHGVLDENVCQARETFLETINHFEKISHVLGALSFPTHDMYRVLKAFLKVLHDNQLQRQSDRENKEQDIETERTTAQEASSQMMAPEDDRATGENSHVSTLPERPDDQSSCLEASATSGNDNGHAPIQRREYDDLLKRIEQLEQRQEDILQEKEKLHQAYLTDVRLSLLMRVRSSSFLKSDSGFSTSTLTSRKGRIADAGKGDKHDRCEAQGEHLHQLTRKEIDGGDLELVKFNREASLHEACQEGNLDSVMHIVSGGLADINCRGRLGRTPVMVAAKAGHLSVVNFLNRQSCGILEVDDNNDTVLHVACMGRNVDVVKCILSNNTINLEKRGRYAWTAIVTSAYYGSKNVFDFLIRKGCDLSVVDDDGDNILHVTCIGGNVDICKYLLSNNVVNIESRGQYNRTPVMTAVSMGHRELFDFLVSKGCDLSVVDGNGENILHVTCIGGNVNICKYLLSKDIVGIESRGQYNTTPVMTAASEGHSELFDFLVSKGCDLSVVDGNGENILHVTCLGGNVGICKYLLSKDIVGIESRGQSNRTPVMKAANQGHRELFDFLVSKGCDLSVVDGNGDNILHVTCFAGNVDICKYLLSKDIVGIESRGQYNRTPVMKAANQGHRELFDFLVSKGCDLSVVDGNGDNILHVTCFAGNVGICKYLLSKDIVGIESRGQCNRTPVMKAANQGQRELFNFLVSKGCDLSVVDGDGDNILHVTCLGGNVGICKYLLSKDIVGIESRGQYNTTPVMTAASEGHRELFDFLVSKGCDLSVVDGNGDNILHVTCIGGNVGICKYLLSKDIVGIESRGQYNRTPVMMAANQGHRELFDFLVSKGCDLSVVDGNGDNILHVTCFAGNVDICKYLLSKDIVGIESRGQSNRTPVMKAANQGHRELFDFLVSKGCDLSVVDGNGENILHVTCIGGNVNICKYLLSKDIVGIESRGQCNRTPVMKAANQGHRELFDFLVSKGCDLSVVDGNGDNILHVTCFAGNVDICKYLLSKDIVGIESRGQCNRTPVMKAANQGHRELFNFLVSKGCDLSVVDGNGDNILHVTCFAGNVDICKYLLSKDIVGIESRGQCNRTPVMTAASEGHRELFDFLT